MDAQRGKSKQISMTKSADKDRCRGALVAILTPEQVFLFWNRVIPQLPKFASLHPQRSTATPVQQNPGLSSNEKQQRFLQPPKLPRFHIQTSTSCPQLGLKGPPAAVLRWEENFCSYQEGDGAATRQGRNAGFPWNFNRQCLQCHWGKTLVNEV